MRQRQVPVLGQSGFYRLAYREWGDPANPNVLLCVHGLTRTGRDFDLLADRLSARWRVICPDMPGRGDSDWLPTKTDYNFITYFSVCAALIARLDVAEVSWLGTSMGGIIGMHLAALPGTPIRRLVVNDVGPFIPEAALRRIADYLGTDPRFDDLAQVERFLRASMTSFGVTQDEHWRLLTEIATAPDGEGKLRLRYDPEIRENFAANLADIDFWPVWDAISCPVLVVHGAQSDILLKSTAEEMTRRGPKAKLIEIPNCGHAPMLMEDDQIADIDDWLRKS